MSYEVRLSPRAKQEIANALSWTKLHFGAKQRDAHRGLIRASLRHLAKNPLQPPSRLRKDIGQGFYMLHIARIGKKARHFFVFRMNGRVVEVQHFLHDAMDVKAMRE